MLHLRLFNIEVTLAVNPYSCFTHLAALHCTISILLSIVAVYTMVAYSNIGCTNVEYVVSFTLVSLWCHIGIKFFKQN